MTADVVVEGVTHRFGSFTALSDVNLTIAAGKFAVLLGPSGCGKTTLLSILGGFLTPSAGSIKIGQRDVTATAPAQRPTTTVFQDYALFPHMTLGDNVGFGLRMSGVGRAGRDAKATEMLQLVRLEEAFNKKPHELSGGQRQRVALARALAVDPDVLLLDEPLGALDLKLRRQMQDELKAIQKRVGTTFIHVTHDQEEAMAIADEIIVMSAGRIQDKGAPEDIYLKPKNRFTAAFMGEANFIGATVIAIDASGIEVETAAGRYRLPVSAAIGTSVEAGDQVDLCFRPEHLKSGRTGQGVINLGESRVVDVAFFGTHHRCHLEIDKLAGVQITAHLPPTPPVLAGSKLSLQLQESDVIILAA